MPESYRDAWIRADTEYANRERERIATLIETLVNEHWWTGGRDCSCGQTIDGPTRTNHTRHLLEVALELDEDTP